MSEIAIGSLNMLDYEEKGGIALQNVLPTYLPASKYNNNYC